MNRREGTRLYLLVALLLTAFATSASLALASAPPAVDLFLTQWVQRLRTPLLDAPLLAITELGYFAPWLALTVAVAAGWWLARRPVEAACVLVTLAAPAFSAALKLVFQRPRPSPDIVAVLTQRTDFGFPSGHTASFTCLLGFLIFLTRIRLPPGWRRALFVCMLAAPIPVVGFSRLYLGHHWFSDILAGYAVGGLWLLVVIAIYRAWTLVQHRLRPPHVTAPWP